MIFRRIAPRVAIGLAIFAGATGFISVPRSSLAQAWTRDRGHGYVSLGVRRMSGSATFGPDFQTRRIANYTQLSVVLYSELGVIDRWLTVSVSGELYRNNELANQGATEGLGDLRLAAWTGLITEPFRLSFGVSAGLPTGDPHPSAGPGADLDATLIAASLPTGDGELDFRPTLIFGTSFGGSNSAWPLVHYLVLEAGWDLRTQGFSDGITYRAELGTKVPIDFIDRFQLILRLHGTESFASQEEVASAFAGIGNGITHTSYSIQLHARVWEGFGLSVARDSAFRARGIIAAAPLSATITWEF